MRSLFACFLLCAALLLAACAKEPVYRGVSEPSWQQLSAEQQQLIIDRSFQTELG